MVVYATQKNQGTSYLELFRDWTWKGEHDGASSYTKTTLCSQEMKFKNVSIIQDTKSIV